MLVVSTDDTQKRTLISTRPDNSLEKTLTNEGKYVRAKLEPDKSLSGCVEGERSTHGIGIIWGWPVPFSPPPPFDSWAPSVPISSLSVSLLLSVEIHSSALLVWSGERPSFRLWRFCLSFIVRAEVIPMLIPLCPRMDPWLSRRELVLLIRCSTLDYAKRNALVSFLCDVVSHDWSIPVLFVLFRNQPVGKWYQLQRLAFSFVKDVFSRAFIPFEAGVDKKQIF